jgi:1-carboxybiuret hydrolase
MSILSAAAIARAVREGATTAKSAIEATLAQIDRLNPALGAFTEVTGPRALARAAVIDSDKHRPHLPLAGVPFAVKNLFDLEGVVTRAGSKINRDNPPAVADAALVQRLEAAGAICVGALNMGEYAYDFTGQNAHDGPSRNPHDLTRMSGGSSGGSASAVAAGLVPIALASDTNGSIRVPASLCGLFGLKPTYGRLSRAGTFPFVSSLDHLGPLARSVEDLVISYDAMQGYDPTDPAMMERQVELTADRYDLDIGGLNVAFADGYFLGDAEPQEAVARVAAALGADRTVSLPMAEQARAAAFLITMSEGAQLHLDRIRTRPQDFDPEVRDRLIAGALLPAVWVERAQKIRRLYRDAVLPLFDEIDIILAPATPLRAPLLGQQTASIGGTEMPVRPNLGIFTQPISFIGLPVVAVPVWIEGRDMPMGVQVIAAPWREDLALRVARQLEREGVARAPVAKAFADG